MQSTEAPARPVGDIGVLDAIYRRRAVRDYAPGKLEASLIRSLLDAAVHAPTAMHQEPCRFAILQDKATLNRLSDDIKSILAKRDDPIHPHGAAQAHDRFTNKEFNAFYNAGTLVVIYAKPAGSFVDADCWLAAENLMLAAYALGLGSCPIGLAVTTLNSPKWKTELGIPIDMSAIVPIILGVPAGETAAVARKKPEILVWT